MHTIRLDISDTIFDKVVFFLNHLPKNEIRIYPENRAAHDITKPGNDLVDFFQTSPLGSDVELERNKETYSARVEF
jgi:hypothetical protein